MPRSAPPVLPPRCTGQGLSTRHPFGPHWTGLRPADRAAGVGQRVMATLRAIRTWTSLSRLSGLMAVINFMTVSLFAES